MRECVTFHVGGSGCEVGSACWDLLRTEHEISYSGQPTNINSPFFHSPFFEDVRGRYIPRSIFIDTEPSVLDEVRRRDIGGFYHPERMINLKEDAANNFARGYYRLSSQLESQMDEVMRKTFEVCDNLQGFLIQHSLGGGTGSGFTPNLLKKIIEENSKKCMMNMTIFPSSKVSNAIVEPYNCILGLQHNSELTDILILFENNSMLNICYDLLNIKQPSYRDLNNLVATIMSTFTSSLRHLGTLNIDLVEFPTNLVPSCLTKLTVPSLAPLTSINTASYQKSKVSEITNRVSSFSSQFFNNEYEEALYMACCFIYRGDVPHRDIFESLNDLKMKKKLRMCDWSSTGFKVGVNSSKLTIPKDLEMCSSEKSVCMISNSTTVLEPLIQIARDYTSMYKKSAFIHWYQGEGMETGEFDESMEYALDVIDEYRTVQNDKIMNASF